MIAQQMQPPASWIVSTGNMNDRLRVIHIKDLPSGWLGKCHALHLGALQAKGEYVLFTDADVHMATDTLSRAVNRMEGDRLDHLCLIFRPQVSSSLLTMLMVDSLAGLISVLKPWRAVDADSCYFFGVGAFNMVRADTYRRCGGHQSLRLCPVDDILLGRLVKAHGGRQECLNGRDCIAVPWYGSVGEMIRGLRKNIFAAVDYRFGRFLLATVVIICCHILPFWGLVLAGGVNQLLFALVLVVTAVFHCIAANHLGAPLRSVCWFLVTPYLKIYMMWHAVIATLVSGGIDWRGTFYPLAELKRNLVPLWPWQQWKKP